MSACAVFVTKGAGSHTSSAPNKMRTTGLPSARLLSETLLVADACFSWIVKMFLPF
jgi:hypothetical protein